jgi:DNA-binding MarR family transcriptional regulator
MTAERAAPCAVPTRSTTRGSSRPRTLRRAARQSRLFPADLFGEPTWDILLDLYVAGRESRRVPTTSACIGAHVPPTTALRWLRILEARGFVERESDGKDGRRTFVRLTVRNAAMDDFLDAMLANIGDGVNASSLGI